MNLNNTFQSVAKATVTTAFSLAALVVTTASAAPTWSTDVSSDWKLAERASAQVIHLTNTVPEGTLHALCSHSGCELFVEPRSGCVPGASYPVLVNSADSVGVKRSQCQIVVQQAIYHQVVQIHSAQDVVTSIIEGDAISIAFPTQGGQMDVMNIRTVGAAKLLATELGQIEPVQTEPVRKESQAVARSEHLYDVVANPTLLAKPNDINI